ncbi:daunorubicin resistance protein DrrA family ABC transporter ATP-binding protein [Ornithinimicrobium humiphilum]
MIELRGVTQAYGTTQVLRGVDLTIGAGVHALLGPNGAGKTTLVGILTTLRPHDAGEVRVLGLDPRTEGPEIRRRISVTGQFAAVDAVLTGTENLVMMGRLLGLPTRRARTRAEELLARFDLTDAARRPVRTWSGGMRRRLDLAVSLIWPPEVLVLDEPTTGLDTRSRLALWAQVEALAAAGTTVVLTTQYLEEADRLADRVCVLDGGRVVADGTPADLKELVGGSVLAVFDDAGAVVEERSTDGSSADVARVAAELAARHPDLHVELRTPTLDDAFLRLTGHHAEQEEAA